VRNAASIERVHEWHEGWPPGGLKLQTYADKWLADIGAPVGAERREALIAYYSSNPNPALKRRGPRDSDKNYFRFMVHQTFFVLRHVELGRPWRRDDASILPCLKMAYDAGYGPAVGRAHKFCYEKDLPMDEPRTAWVRRWQESVLNDAARMVPVKRRVGRPNGPTPPKWRDDLEIFVLVNFWRSQVAGVYQTGKPHWVSLDKAFEITRAMRYRAKAFDAADRRYIATLRMAYKRTVNRFSRVVSLKG
jgi:hypothetical protein